MKAPAQLQRPDKTLVWIILGVGGTILFGVVFLVVLGGYLYVKDERLRGAAQADASKMAKLIAGCGSPLPASTYPVPAEVPARPYYSTTADWSQPAFSCRGASFEPQRPQHYRYRWVRETEATGRVIADWDANFDGAADTTIEVRVECSAERCQAHPPTWASDF